MRNALLRNRQIDPAEETHFIFAIGVTFYVLPWMGFELLDTARAVAEFDLPKRVLGLWWGDDACRPHCQQIDD
jgi:hypothetical protein